MILYTKEKTVFLQEHWVAFGKAANFGHVDRFMDDFFAAWIGRFREMEYLTADSSVQVFVKRRMVKSLREKMEHILDAKTTKEKAVLISPLSVDDFPPHNANDDKAKGPQRYDPIRASLNRGLLPRATGNKRRRALLDAAVIRPKIIPRQHTASTTRIRSLGKVLNEKVSSTTL
ncbi:hypothetical protein EYR40_010563 [Pleurotus pulmonarius]|nr:hypothetical protein EYR36_010047 [Pleurotus pulmonarius]KAF4589007.1 hypothetical protein EYR40_010563 [Pleurotus pulmonarius]